MAVHGSSPRMRGARHITHQACRGGGIIHAVVTERIIPADAGSTICVSAPRRMREDHPRGCGEHDCGVCWLDCEAGSSPRMRGARVGGQPAVQERRIIPADAGSTRPWSSRSRRRRDHPRGCGEHLLVIRILGSCSGSSPRMRGAPAAMRGNTTPGRIIPADAGSTWRWSHCRPAAQDHPRGCGEHKRYIK